MQCLTNSCVFMVGWRAVQCRHTESSHALSHIIRVHLLWIQLDFFLNVEKTYGVCRMTPLHVTVTIIMSLIYKLHDHPLSSNSVDCVEQ